MTIVDVLNGKNEGELRNFVLGLISGRYDGDDKELLSLLAVYEGPVGFLRRLYLRLSEAHRETVAIAFLARLRHLNDDAAADSGLSAADLAILELADPFLRHSSIKGNAAQYLEAFARRLAADHAPVDIIVAVNLALRNVGEKLNTEYWLGLSRDYGAGVHAIVLSGLSAINVDDAFRWLRVTPSSRRLTQLLKVHLPTLRRDGQQKLEKNLSELVSAKGTWSMADKLAIKDYCELLNLDVAPWEPDPRLVLPGLCPEGDPMAARRARTPTARKAAKRLRQECDREMKVFEAA